MKKSTKLFGDVKFPRLEKFIRIMKLTTFLILFSIGCAFAGKTYSQTKLLNLKMGKSTIKNVLSEIENQSEFYFMYSGKLIDVERSVSVNIENQKIEEALNSLFEGTDVDYVIKDRFIVLTQKAYGKDYLTELQQISVSGTVKDKSNQPLPGVTVFVKGTTQGTVTDVDGNFSISNIPENATLVFSFVGMRTQEIFVAGKTNIDVILEEDTKAIEEVVVTALGITRSKKSLGYSTQQVDTEQLTTVKGADFGTLISGKVAGVSVTSSAGAAGVTGGSRIIIRGDRSIQNNNQPLYVVDGVPNGSGWSIDDVESINVLKGPAASALYGSSANNGVIVITTKKGKPGEPRIEINSSSNFDLPYLYPEFQNEYAQGASGIYQSNAETSSWGPKMTGQTVQNWNGETTTLDPQPNNFKKLFEVGYNFVNSFSYSTGNEKSTTYLSYNNRTAKGILKDNKMVNHAINLRVTAELMKKLNMDFKLAASTSHVKDKPETGINQFSPMQQLVRMPRSIRDSDIKEYSYKTNDGELKHNTWAPKSVSINNPYWSMFGFEAPSTGESVSGNLSLKYDITDYLYVQLRGSVGYGNSKSEQKKYWDTQYIYSGRGDYRVSFSRSQRLNSDILVSFNKEIVKDFKLGLNLGAEIKDAQGHSHTSYANGLTVENKFALSYSASLSSSDGESRIQKQSVYGMGQLSFREYLFLDFTARNDWSSTLPPPYDYFYPSVGLTGIISDMVELPSVISFAKVRGSYAEVGNDASFASIFQSFYSNTYGPVGMFYPGSTKVADQLIPEKTKSWEFGADLRFFDNRLAVDATWYKSNTYNQLVQITSPLSSGYSRGWVNCGNIQNTGVEVMINARPIDSPNFKWSATLNFARNKNKVIELSETLDEYEIRSPNLAVGQTWIIKGRPFGEIYTKGYVRDDNGNVIVDSQGLPLIMGEFDLYLGNFNYDWRSGLTNTFDYKNWQMSFLIDLNYGGVRQSATEAAMLKAGTSKESLVGRETGIVVEGVKEDGSVNDIVVSAEEYARRIGGRITDGSGEAFNHSATNSRLRELSIGYKFPIRSTYVKSLTISAVGRNLFYIYNGCKWFDPDVSYDISTNGQGAENAFLPGTRTLGVNIKLSL